MYEQAKILIAEDETLVRLDLRGLLEAAGHTVCAEARDGEEAVALAAEHAPDLVLMDVKMPRLDGVDAARRILAERHVPIVMLTAYGYGDLVSRALDAGVYGYIVKPFHEPDLLLAVRTALELRGESSMPIDVRSGDGSTTWSLSFLRQADGGLDVSLRDTPR